MQNRRTADYYAVLELGSDATDIEIKRAWHEQMQVWHPDRFVHSPTLHRKAETRTQLINQAYQTLSDPTSRARYDAERHHPSAAPPLRAILRRLVRNRPYAPAKNCEDRKRC